MATSLRLTVTAALASAVLLWLSSPAVGAGWLAWIAIVPVAAAVIAAPGTRTARVAVPLAVAVYLELLLVPAFPFGVAEGQWGDPVVPVLVADSPLIVIALVAVPLAGALLYLARFGEPWGASRLSGAPATLALVAVPALAWTALDFARANLDPGALWGPLFLSQAGQPAGALAGLAGPWLVTIAIVAVNYGLAVAIVRRRIAPALGPVLGVVALVLAAAAVERGAADRPAVRVAAIQPGYDTAERERPELRYFRRGTFDLAALDLIADLGELTRDARASGAELVVWPEASMYVDPRSESEAGDALRDLALEVGVPIVVPFFRPSPLSEGEVLAVVPGPGGAALTESTPKHRPHWFIGERRAAGEIGPIDAGIVEVGALLGTDTQDARNGAALTDAGAELLASVTHDWRQSAVPAAAYGRLSARAAGAPVVRADWRFGSAIYAADGTVLADAGPDRDRTAIVADVAPAASPSPYTRLGDWVGWLAVAAVALAALGSIGSTIRLRRRLSREGARGAGGRAPRRGSPPRPPARERPPAAAAPKPPPP
ncbi:MAG TPA: hypothetical protein VK919_11485 [Solirubrobacterales bacterium]|nr:hypothetical protein [Solirubrobacterales bacterium]